MKRLAPFLATAILAFTVAAPSATADFGLKDLDATFSNEDGSTASQAGSHPFAFTTTVGLNTSVVGATEVLEGEIADLKVEQIAGLVGSQNAVRRCSAAEFNTRVEGRPSCADSTAVGVAAVKGDFKALPPNIDKYLHVPIYNLEYPPGTAARLGFVALNVPITIDVGVNPDPPYNLVATLNSTPQSLLIYGSSVTLWGNPASPAHDALRGDCVGNPAELTDEPVSLGKCPAKVAEAPFITLPRSCEGPLDTVFTASSWAAPDVFTAPQAATTHDDSLPPSPTGMTGCGKLSFHPTIDAKPTTEAASSPTGLDFSLDVEDEGLNNPADEATAAADIRKAVVTLPEGFSANPSLAEGLNVCTEADLDRETASSGPGVGCPNASKIGTVEVETPLLEERVQGSLYIAKPYENPFDSLLAMYIVIKNERLGIIIRQPLEVRPDPVTGRLTTVAEELPELPYSHFRLHFREGTRSPLASPPACGSYDAEATLYPSSGQAPLTTTSTFEIVAGPNGGPCPSGGLPPFRPGLVAGTVNNAAGRFSPFNLRLSRSDSEQEFTRFSIKLPPGITGKLAGIPYCPDAAIAAAKARTGPHGGQEELDSPSCPAASEIGRTLAGSGVGPSLAYAPGKVYLAGPYNGSNLSMVAITAARVGPFDLGTVVVRQAFKIDPETAEVFIDSTGSDPIPHIIQGIPVHLRDIRAYVDRPDFVLNPSDCTRTSTASTLLGSGLDFGSAADDRPVTVSTPFQAADCAALPFKPKLGLKLVGGTRRGSHPAFKATLRMKGIGEAGIQRAQVTLPRSEFIENAHFNTICTRVQFKAGAGNGAECPAGSIYGRAKAVTPILGEALEGPVFLRSSEHQLPDLVVALHNQQIDFVLVGRVDSVKGQLRNTFEAAPDAPVSSFVLEMQGGKKGLFVNSTNLCRGKHRALADFTGQNGKRSVSRPALQVKCKGKKGKRKRARR
jgi:hypothetical protein